MSVNQTTTKQLTEEAQTHNNELNARFYRIQLWASQIIALGVAGLTAAPYSMTSPDATALFNSAQDMDNLRKVWQGLMYVTSGATLNSGVPNNNDATHFGYPFYLNPSKTANLGY